jgi:hypothetical protein
MLIGVPFVKRTKTQIVKVESLHWDIPHIGYLGKRGDTG